MSVPTVEEVLTIGQGGLRVAPLGVGTWAWGEQRLWGYGVEYGEEDLAAAVRTSLDAGVTLFDTAEFYGRGESERLLGRSLRRAGRHAVIATKFFPWPWRRFEPRAIRRAVAGSLRRLGTERIDLYQIHFPLPIFSIAGLMDALADVVADGKVRAVGVSNYTAEQTRRAQEALARRGVPLASNQVQYSLLWRRPEVDGVLAACREIDVTLIAYSPLAQGLLTGKYGPTARPGGWRRAFPSFSAANLGRAMPVVELLRGIGADHGGKTPGQVALNWLIRQPGVLPIPGAKNERQAASNAGALGWSLTDAEVAALDRVTQSWRQ